jgi:hypothetical protein
MQLNSDDAEAVERSMTGWERALGEYKKAVRPVARELPLHSRRLLELSLHDWKLVTIKPSRIPPAGRSPARLIMVLEHHNDLTVLSYALTQKLRRLNTPKEWPMGSRDHVYWLYDEVELGGSDQQSFVHRVLFSDGTTLIVPFSSCDIAQAELDHSMSHSDLKRIA